MTFALMLTVIAATTVLTGYVSSSQDNYARRAPTELDQLVARAKSLELNTPYVPPPGDPLAHHAAGYAKVMCSAVFITGLAPDCAAESVGFFTAPGPGTRR
jgi:hypothetical protein